jgi:hypothetical protein
MSIRVSWRFATDRFGSRLNSNIRTPILSLYQRLASLIPCGQFSPMGWDGVTRCG